MQKKTALFLPINLVPLLRNQIMNKGDYCLKELKNLPLYTLVNAHP
jgi:hypothetical protein